MEEINTEFVITRKIANIAGISARQFAVLEFSLRYRLYFCFLLASSYLGLPRHMESCCRGFCIGGGGGDSCFICIQLSWVMQSF